MGYTSHEFAWALKKHNLRQSVRLTGICEDNAMAESFFAALRTSASTETGIPPLSTHAVTS